jgi:PAS domain S-box-containing protein
MGAEEFSEVSMTQDQELPALAAAPAIGPQAYLKTILDGIGEGFYAVDETWRITEFNARAEHHFGLKASAVIGRVLWDLFPTARETSLGKVFQDAMSTRETIVSEAHSVLFDDRWLSYRLFPLNRGLGIVFRDITDRKKAEEQRDLLVRELYHRVNNTLATVQAIASLTFDKSDARERFAGRLKALSSAHSILARENWDGASLSKMIHLSLAPYRSSQEDRFTVDGPDLRFDAKAVLAVSMALHELCTNAAKYGALSQPDGRVSVRWDTTADRFRLSWEETGGPPVTPPARRGFGSAMIEQVLTAQLEADVSIDFRISGLVCRIDAPLGRVREQAPTDGQ